ncbi:MAG: 50S ribosomal protein L15e [Euryarchaeota archaeon]|nr:50S ribosomal protein L15e [Euryarchaeota archaeon]
MPSAYTYMERSFLSGEMRRERLMSWRRGPAVVPIAHPTRPGRARSLGYKAKQGVVVVRARVRRGGRRKMRFSGGRKTKHMGINRMTPAKSIQRIAEERAGTRYPNMEVVNSYWVAEDGHYHWYEVILADRVHPSVQANPTLAAIVSRRGRAHRGLTSAGRMGRGL